MKVSVIVPVINEAENLHACLTAIFTNASRDLLEVIVVDGGSQDSSVEIALELGSKVLVSKECSRASQMNLGARESKGEILYFVHADTSVLPGFIKDIQNAVGQDFQAGCYRYRFDSDKILLKINSWFTRFNGILSGGGDQTLFISKKVFNTLGGFDENYVLMEDFDLVRRIRKNHRLKVIPRYILVSARKYDANSWWSVQVANLYVFTMFIMKKHPDALKKAYNGMLANR